MSLTARSMAVLAALALAATACESGPVGLAPTPAGTGARVKFDTYHKPLPEIPLPNDFATRFDATASTLRRVNASMVAPTVWEQIRSSEGVTISRSATSVVARRQLRRFGAMTQVEELSNQARITIPSGFRDSLELFPGQDVVLVGCECGIEIWSLNRWQNEQKKLMEHETLRAEAEMRADVVSAGTIG